MKKSNILLSILITITLIIVIILSGCKAQPVTEVTKETTPLEETTEAKNEETEEKTPITIQEERFPESIYPPPLKPNPEVIVAGFGGEGCPNLKGVEPPDKPTKEELFSAVFSKFGHTEEGDLELSDRAFWPTVKGVWKERREQREYQPERISIDQLVPMPASESPYAELASNYCSEETVELSWCVAVLPKGASKIEDAPSLTSYYYLINRSGNWLIWFSPH
jgi:hypothetical protein